MGNLSITPAIPAADGTGAASSVGALGLEKTIYVDGTFTGAVTVEANCGQGFVPVATLRAPGRQTVKIAAEEVRVVRSATTAIPGTPAVTVSGNDDGALFADLAVGEPGASSDLKAFGTFNTIMVEIGVGKLLLTGLPIDAETTTIGDKVYTWEDTLTDVDGNVHIGADAAASVANLVDAINLGAGSGVDYAASMTVNADVQAIIDPDDADNMIIKALDSSGSLRGTSLTENLTNGSWENTTIGKFLDGVVQIQTSEDDSVWTDLCAFQTPGQKSLEVVARYMRVNHVNNGLSSNPTVSVGAINDDTAHKPMNTLVSGANVEWDAAKGLSAHLVLAENLTMDNPINCEAGMVLHLIMEQDGGGGNTAAWGTAFQWAAGTDPVISAGGAAVDRLHGTVMTEDASGVATRILMEFAQAFAD